MHEMSLAMNIVALVCDRTRAAGARRVEEVELEVGSLSGVLAEALTFCFAAAAADTPAAGARLLVREIEARARCLACGRDFTTASLVEPCPDCGGYATELIRGREISVLSLTVDDEEEDNHV